MNHKMFGIFGKVFFYTLLILILVISIMFGFFSKQIKAAVESTQKQQVSEVFQPFMETLERKSNKEIIELAQDFHHKNTSFEFALIVMNGEVLYQTDNFFMNDNFKELPEPRKIIIKEENLNRKNFNFIAGIEGEQFQLATLLSGNIRLIVSSSISGSKVYHEFAKKAVIAFVLIFAASIFAAAVFAGTIAKPIQRIAADTKKMSDLKAVSPPLLRKDEIGQLAGDVFKMYKKLKVTIQQLETEIKREKQMEESQRYFFAAASHELKTPIAAVSALLEGMMEEVIEPAEYSKYMKECLKMMNVQSSLVTEILEIVNLDNAAIQLKNEEIQLKGFIMELLISCRAIAESKGQEVTVDITEGCTCVLDRRLLGKALSNIFTNAVQNSPEGGEIKIIAQECSNLRTSTGQAEEMICLTIFNSGAGIPREALKRLFEPFYTEDKARSRERGHTGLGLTIVKKAFDCMGVAFILENEKDGVSFRIYLPKSKR